MPDATPIYGFPFGTLTDAPVDLLSVPELAQAVEDQLGADVRPIGDAATYSMYLTGGDISFTASQNKNILTTGAITLTRDQWVLLSGKARITNQTGGASGLFALYIDVDTVIHPQLSTGAIWVGANGSINERPQLSIPVFSVFLTAGSHTIRLRGDRDSTVATHNVQAADVLNNTYNPTTLTVII